MCRQADYEFISKLEPKNVLIHNLRLMKKLRIETDAPQKVLKTRIRMKTVEYRIDFQKI